jgi:hypothetical protein
LYWQAYDGCTPYQCLEGQDLRFIPRPQAGKLDMPACLRDAWDAALAARRASVRAVAEVAGRHL